MDQNNLIVYLEIEDGRVADVSLELLTKGRVLADKLGVKLEALAVGDDLTCSRRSSRRYASWVPHASVVTSVPA